MTSGELAAKTASIMFSNAGIIAFAATSQPEAAKTFYRDQLGLTLVEESPYALVFRSGATMVRVQRVGAFEPHPFTALGWDVPDIRATAAALQQQGIETMRVAYVEQDAAGIWWTPNGDGIAWFKDPDGNTLSLTQFAT
jgi:catechol 2,3-dioxygenase-like lactoylglutathione lyase family enzyme